MASAPPSTNQAGIPFFTPDAFGPFNDLAAAIFRSQQLQLQALAAWQESIVALQRELWDEWTCRWAGGIPIDA